MASNNRSFSAVPSNSSPKDVVDAPAQGFARGFQLFQQATIDLAFAGVGRDEVPEMADLGLADPVDTAEPLLDLVRVPGQVVVDHQVAALKVHAFASRVVGDQHQHVAVLHEPLDDLAPIFAGDATMDDLDGIGAAKARPDPVVQVVAACPWVR